MCYGCYEEAGKPTIINERTKKAAELIRKLYEQDGCGCGGYAHIVVDDWNLEDKDINWCIAEANKGEYEHILEEGKMACIETLEFLEKLTKDERYSALALADNFISTK